MDWMQIEKLRMIMLMSVTYVYVDKEMMHKQSFYYQIIINFEYYILTP
jgi:hypothetical protein